MWAMPGWRSASKNFCAPMAKPADSFRSLLNPPLPAQPASTIGLPVTEKAGDTIGRYKLLEQIGEGGCGVVYMAEQQEPVRRRVALKVIKLGMDTRQVVARFEAERQALALMDHPNIARVLDAGSTNSGRPFFVMELVRGVKITEFCDRKELSTRERIELFIRVCQAVQHAHQKGIIHRDIKPSNILVTMLDGAPVPKVIDFGIAKATNNQPLTDKTLFTAFEQFIGTPAYMSPEQADMSGEDIDTRTDIYSLGVVLYELLTGKTPFDGEALLRSGIDEIRRTIRDQEPPKPSTRLHSLAQTDLTTTAEARHADGHKLIQIVKGDLDWIVMKCLEKERGRRYETVNGLAMDVRRHLNNEPVVARPPSRLYEFQKTIRRHKFGFAAATALITVLAVGVLASTWQAIRATRAEHEQSRLREEAQRARVQAEANERKAGMEAAKSREVAQFLAAMLESVGPSRALGRDTTMLREILDKAADDVGKRLSNQPEAEAELRSTLGNTYLKLGEFTRAAVMHRRALELRRTLFAAPNALIAASLTDLARALVNRGQVDQYVEAERYVREAIAMQKQLFGREHPDVATSLYVLASCVQRQGRLAEGEALHRDTLALRRSLFGNDHPDVASSLDNLALTLHYARRPAECEIHAREALAIQRRHFGPKHPDVAYSLSLVAAALNRQGKFAEAEAAFAETYSIRLELLTIDHPDLVTSLIHYGDMLRDQGKLAEAEALYRRELTMRPKFAGVEHSAVARILQSLADVLAKQGNFAEAESTARQALSMRQKLLRPDHPDIVTSIQRLAAVFQMDGRTAEAETVYRDELKDRKAKLGETHLAVGLMSQAFVQFLVNHREWSEAKAQLTELLALTEKQPENSKRALDDCLTRIARQLQGASKFVEAEEVARMELALEKQISGSDHSFVANSLHALAAVLKDAGKFSDAELSLREELRIRRNNSGSDGETSHALNDLLEVLRLQGKSSEAEPLAREKAALDAKAAPSKLP